MPRTGSIILVCFCLLPMAARAQPEFRRAAPPAEARLVPYSGALPVCGDPFVLAEIAADFKDREAGFWASGLSLVGWFGAAETGFRSNGDSYIPRRYCEALAGFNDGSTRRIGYNIGEGLGFSSIGWGVEWCVEGLDRDLSFAPHCKMTQP